MVIDAGSQSSEFLKANQKVELVLDQSQLQFHVLNMHEQENYYQGLTYKYCRKDTIQYAPITLLLQESVKRKLKFS